MRRQPLFLAPLALLALAAAARADTPAPRAKLGTPESAAMTKARKLIDDQKTIIGRFMHPTSSLDRIACTKTKVTDSGDFVLTYAFYFDKEKYHSSLRFKFFEDGSLDAIEVAGTSTWIKPFQAADLVASALAKTVPQIGDRVAMALKDGAARTALEFWLRSR